MNVFDYQAFYDQVGMINGWDFRDVKCVTEGVQWDFFSEVTKRCKKSDLLLDIGTGGGEAILSIADCALLLTGIDSSSGMIKTATRNAVQSGLSNVRFFQMAAEKLDFPDQFFQVVSCRHSDFCAKEIARVLIKGGIFLTQQVSENDKRNLKEAFGRGQAWGAEAGTLQQQYLADLSEAGFTDIQSFTYNASEYYQTAEDLLFLLKHTPIIPDFGRTESDFHILQRFIMENQTEKGIQTNSERFMIIARI